MNCLNKHTNYLKINNILVYRLKIQLFINVNINIYTYYYICVYI